MARLKFEVSINVPGGMMRTASMEADVSNKDMYTAFYETARVVCEQGVMAGMDRTTTFDLSLGGATEIFDCELLVTEVKDSKKYHKVKGGKYTEFGVRVWDEVLTASGLEITGFAPIDLRGWRATILMKDNGQPLKVVNLVKVK